MGQVPAVHPDGAGPEITVQHLLRVVMKQSAALQQKGHGPVTAAGLFFRAVDRLVHRQAGISSQPAGQLQQPLQPLGIARPVDQGAQQDGSHVDHGIEMLAEQGLVRIVDGVKGFACGLHSHPGADRVHPVVHQRQEEQDGLDDALNGEGPPVLPRGADTSVAGHHADAQLVPVRLGQLRDVASHPALPGEGAIFLHQLFQQRVHDVPQCSSSHMAAPEA